jgi:YHS domain-containing protein
MTTDLVCNMEVDENDTEFISNYKGKKYYFCSQLCKITFDKNPKKYVLK